MKKPININSENIIDGAGRQAVIQTHLSETPAPHSGRWINAIGPPFFRTQSMRLVSGGIVG
ncbi:MAG: hypothetical protein FWB85_09320 [Chitinispirillia bacterium]|nr:hypothetical protein [Chitinispirillia bacterium]